MISKRCISLLRRKFKGGENLYKGNTLQMKKHKHKHPRKIHRHTPKVHKAKEPEGKFRWIEDLRNIHKGKEIWVLGSGPSLDDFPDGFFDWDPEYGQRRIAIAVKYTFIAWPKAKYYQWSLASGWLRAYFLENQHLLEKCIVNLRPKRKGKGGSKIGSQPIYMPINTRGAEYRDYEIVAPHLAAGKQLLNRYPATYTLVHWALQAAVIMGASKVTAVGCEAKYRKFQAHALKRGMNKIYGLDGIRDPKLRVGRMIPKDGYSEALVKGDTPGQKAMRAGTDWLAKAVKPFGVQVARYYYRKGYEYID